MSSTRECLQSKVDYVRKFFTINEKKSNSKPDDSVSFLEYSISKEGIAPDPKLDPDPKPDVEKIRNAKAPTNHSNRLLG